MKLVPLGINGYLPINGKHSSCFLVLFEDAAFLLDAGTGAARLHEPAIGALLDPYRELHVLLSHYHVDHTTGLYYMFTAWKNGTIHVHAPVCPFVQADPVEAIRRYFSPPLNSYRLEDTNLCIHPINGPELLLGGHRVRCWPQRHPGGSIGIRLDDVLVYATDTVVVMENVDHAKGVRLLLHELWLHDEDAARQEKESQRHACFSPVVDFIKAAQPARFMPVHLYPHYDDETRRQMTAALQARTGVTSELPVEGFSYTI